MNTSMTIQEAVDFIKSAPLKESVALLNEVRELLHSVSPFKSEPVDFVKWVENQSVIANDYNPNSVAPPEMELLRLSIDSDGYTQPIVSMPSDGRFEVIDGFHRHRVGKECKEIQERVKGYLPLVQIRSTQQDKSDRMASTIRHNRARGKHKVEAMSDIVIELKRRNWSDEKIAKNLGMDADEVLRLCQITGLAEAFKDQEFSEAWEVDSNEEIQGEVISDAIDMEVNDKDRIFHTWEKWECFRAGFYSERTKGMTMEEGEDEYSKFLSDIPSFESALAKVIFEWKNSCEHYLTNEKMNRIAWLGQASICLAKGIPSCCRSGFMKMTLEQRNRANEKALEYLNKWLVSNGRAMVTMTEAGINSEAEIY